MTKKKKNILECMSTIVDQFGAEKTIDVVSTECKSEIRLIASTLEITPIQVLILSAIVECSCRSRVDMQDVASTMNLSYTKMLSYEEEIKSLKEKGLLIQNGDGYIMMPQEALTALKANKKYVLPNYENISESLIIERIGEIINYRSQEEMSEYDATMALEELRKLNPQSTFFKVFKKYELDEIGDDETMLFYYLVYEYTIEDDDRINWWTISNFFEQKRTSKRLERAFRNNVLMLQKTPIIEPSCEDGMKSGDCIHICDNIKDELLAGIGGIRSEVKQKVSLVSSQNLAAKTLYFNAEEKSQIERLRNLLDPKNYDNICKRLKANGQRSGFSCIFYGSPGTGKTESVYQLAKQTGRDIFPVEVPELRSCWVGESEKLVKNLFVRYRNAVKNSEVAPILLFNEADAIFGQRMEGAQRSVDKMENTMQNIILQEMETLDGILIATTNLACNLDAAFERRFLFKVRFNKPEVPVKAKIWKSMLPGLTEVQAETLAGEFDFSGGQIENISRKKEVQEIISGEDVTFEEIQSFCKEETLTDPNRTTKRIGFK